jgi:DNA repair protein RecO (recombination protein O)
MQCRFRGIPEQKRTPYAECMALLKDSAIVLRRLDYSETSQVLVLFGREHGQVRLIAKGIKRGSKKAFATGIDLLEMGSIVFVRADGRSGLGTLTEWRQAEAFLGLRSEIRRLYAGQYAAEITGQLTEEGDPHPELFDAMATLLRALAGGDDCVAAVVRFQMGLLTSIGLMPDFQGCAVCHREGRPRELHYFSAGHGGLICRDCEPGVIEKRRVPPGVAAALAAGTVPPPLAPATFDLLNYANSYAMGRPSKLAPYVIAG